MINLPLAWINTLKIFYFLMILICGVSQTPQILNRHWVCLLQVAGMFQDVSIGETKVTYVIKRVTVLNVTEVSWLMYSAWQVYANSQPSQDRCHALKDVISLFCHMFKTWKDSYKAVTDYLLWWNWKKVGINYYLVSFDQYLLNRG